MPGKNLQSYRATYLLSYRVTDKEKNFGEKLKLPSYLPTQQKTTKNKATELPSYQVTDTKNKFWKKIKTIEHQINKLPSYLPTELPGVKNFRWKKS